MSALSATNVAYENRNSLQRDDATNPLWHLRAAQLLFDRGLLKAGEFGKAIVDELAWHSDLGSVLIGKGLIRPHDFYQALAEAQELPFVDLLEEPPDPDLLFPEDRTNYATLKLIPWRLVEGHWLIATVDTGEAQRQWAERRFGNDFSFVITSPFDVFWAQRDHFREYDNLRARDGLLEWKPEHSAKETFTRPLKLGFGIAAALYLLFLIAAPAVCLVATMAVLTVIYTVTFGFKAVLTWLGASRKLDMHITDGAVAGLSDAELPIYTVLVPMYREAKVLPLLFDALKKLDYPASKLEVKLVLEEDDQETIAAAKALRPPGTFEIVRVPNSYPRTKPKACNYALFFARGEFVTIYDAEDQPEPDQLKKAVIAFRTGGSKLACVQAKLDFFNHNENWLTRMFTLEYSHWFDFLLPGLDKLKMPIPLGGTSNHFRLKALRKVRAWDPYNVTEDIDLGIRLAQEGFTIGVINSTTFEEANGVLASGIKQRSRRIKGYMQTWLVHMRHPVDLWRKVGWRGTFSFHFSIGAPPFLNLVNPLMWAIAIAFYLLGDSQFSRLFPVPVGTLATFNLIFSNLLLIYFGIVAALKRRHLDLVPAALMQPFYWALHAVAAYKALWQLIARPHYWEKTEHGMSTVTARKLETVSKEAA